MRVPASDGARVPARVLRPQDDSVAYRRSSPIYLAEGLRAPLLMAHGMVDVNANFQDIVELTERLIELGKTDWTLAPYPVEDHAFVRPSSWTDEYRRIDALFDRALLGRAAVGGRGGHALGTPPARGPGRRRAASPCSAASRAVA